jgi:uncharacterized protein (TIGR02246 family)
MRALAAAAVLLMVSACQAPPPAEMTDAERAQIEAEVLAWSDQWLEAGTNLDAEGVAALFDQDDGHFVSGVLYSGTWAEFLSGSRELYGGWEEWGGTWDARRVDILGPGVALMTGQATGPLTLADGRRLTNRARFSFVVRETEGEWRGLYGHVSAASTPLQ